MRWIEHACVHWNVCVHWRAPWCVAKEEPGGVWEGQRELERMDVGKGLMAMDVAMLLAEERL